MSQTFKDVAALAAIAGCVLFWNLGAAPLWDRDEPRNAGCAAEMAARGDWVTPVFNGKLRTAKPVLLYWLIMSAYAVFGVNELAARFWSALLGVGTVLLTYGVGRRLLDRRAAWWGAAALATSLMFDVAGRAATPDAALIFFTTASLYLFVLGAGAREAPKRLSSFPAAWPWAAAIYALMGLAVLAKGPVGAVMPAGIIALVLLGRGERPAAEDRVGEAKSLLRRAAAAWAPRRVASVAWSMRPVTAALMILLVAGPWYALVGLRTDGLWLKAFFVTENIERALRPMENHAGSILYYPAAIAVGFFPWSLFLAPMLIELVKRVRRGDPQRDGYRLLGCWVGFYLFVFSLARTKLPNYVTPAYPALALMAGAYLRHWFAGDSVAAPFWPRAAFATMAAVGAAMGAGAAAAAARFAPGEQGLAAIGLIPLAGGAWCWWCERRGRRGQVAWGLPATAAALSLALFAVAAPRVGRHQQYAALLAAARRGGGETASLGAVGCLEPSWVFYGGRPIQELTLGGGQRAVDYVYDQTSGRWRAAPRPSVETFLARAGRPRLITTQRVWERLRDQLPRELTVVASGPYFLKKERLVVVSPAASAATAAAAGPARPQRR